MRGGYARRSRRESCQEQSALPARFKEQKSRIRASVRAFQDMWMDAGSGVLGEGRELSGEFLEWLEVESVGLPRASSLSSSLIRSRLWSLTSSSSRTFFLSNLISSSMES